LIRLQHQNHAVNRGFPLHPSLKNAGRHEFCGLAAGYEQVDVDEARGSRVTMKQDWWARRCF